MLQKPTANITLHDSSWSKRRDFSLTLITWFILIGICFWLLGHISRTILLLVLASFLSYALYPAVNFFERFLPRFWSILLVYIIFFSGLGFILYTIVNTAVFQFVQLAYNIRDFLVVMHGGNEPAFITTLKGLGVSQDQISQVGGQLTTEAESLTRSIVPFLRSVFSTTLDFLVVAILSIYMILDGEKMTKWLQNNSPRSWRSRVLFLLKTIERVVGGYIRSQLLLAAIVGILIGIGMTIFQVPYAILLGVMAFVLAFVPILGTIISGAVCVGLALTHGWVIAALVLLYFIIMHIIEADILGPRIVGKALGLHPIISIIALIGGTELFGITGALFASPIAGVTQTMLVTLWTEWKASHPEEFAGKRKQLVQNIK